MGEDTQSRRHLALVVDDDELVGNFVREVLEGQEFEVLIARDGKSAGLIFDQHSDLSLVVTDILMPNADGIQLIIKIRRVAALEGRPKIIAISGGGLNDADSYLRDARELGADITLAKPFSVSDLKEALSHLGLTTPNR